MIVYDVQNVNKKLNYRDAHDELPPNMVVFVIA